MLEQKHTVADGFVVVGVHSAKFFNERRDDSIADAVRRYHIQHPVVNDAELALWKAIGVRSWPTLAVLGTVTIRTVCSFHANAEDFYFGLNH